LSQTSLPFCWRSADPNPNPNPRKSAEVRLVLALVISKLDYCNSLLAGLPQSTLTPLQRVQNAAARLVFELGARDHITRQFDTVALATSPLTHPVLHDALCFYGNCPAYLTVIWTVTEACSRFCGLRSTSSSNFALPQPRSRFGERSFSNAGPSAWNDLPSDNRAVWDMKAFRQAVKLTILVWSLVYFNGFILSAFYLRDYWNAHRPMFIVHSVIGHCTMWYDMIWYDMISIWYYDNLRCQIFVKSVSNLCPSGAWMDIFIGL